MLVCQSALDTYELMYIHVHVARVARWPCCRDGDGSRSSSYGSLEGSSIAFGSFPFYTSIPPYTSIHSRDFHCTIPFYIFNFHSTHARNL